MKDGFYWYKNGLGMWNPIAIITDFMDPSKQLVFYIGYNKPEDLSRIDKTRFGPEIILPKELQNGNKPKDNSAS